ncbi:MAG: class I tRNA ligase family protein, partial [Chloroflexota bacterium]
LRYYLTAVMPETRDSDWSWSGYVERNNTELVGNWGNLVNRALSMTQRYFNGVVPDPGELTAKDIDLLAAVDDGFDTVSALYDGCKFRAVVQENLRLSSLVNQYLEDTSPWTTAKSDMQATARSLYTTIQAISSLKILWSPILPHTSQALHAMLGEEGTLFGVQIVETYQENSKAHTALTYDSAQAVGGWTRTDIPVGRQLPKPAPLFKKLEGSMADDELNHLSRPG